MCRPAIESSCGNHPGRVAEWGTRCAGLRRDRGFCCVAAGTYPVEGALVSGGVLPRCDGLTAIAPGLSFGSGACALG